MKISYYSRVFGEYCGKWIVSQIEYTRITHDFVQFVVMDAKLRINFLVSTHTVKFQFIGTVSRFFIGEISLLVYVFLCSISLVLNKKWLDTFLVSTRKFLFWLYFVKCAIFRIIFLQNFCIYSIEHQLMKINNNFQFQHCMHVCAKHLGTEFIYIICLCFMPSTHIIHNRSHRKVT